MSVPERRALVIGAAAYLLWGLFPLYFRLLADVAALEIVAYRAIWAFVFCVAALPLTRQWRAFLLIVRDRRTALTLATGALLLAINWGIYVFGVNSGRTLDASMGYFMNPLVSALLGVFVLGERLRRTQWVAFGVGGLAVAVLTFGYGEIPWIALSLAVSFGIYGLVKKQLGGRVPVLPGLTVETLSLVPLALGYLAWLAWNGSNTVAVFSATSALLVLSGPITAVPLLLFAYAAARLKLSTIGMLQYIAPLMLFVLGWLAYGEPMPLERWVGFVLVWIAVALFAIDAARAVATPRLSSPSSRGA